MPTMIKLKVNTPVIALVDTLVYSPSIFCLYITVSLKQNT